MFLDIQINYLLWLQHFREITNGVLNPFFITITNFGEILIPLFFAAAIYWGLNKKIGEFLIMAHALILVCCQFLKMIFCIPRPWMLNSNVHPVKDILSSAKGYSFPSGHTSCAAAIWGGLAINLWDNKIVRYTLLTLILCIGFSRNYLGVHTPQDVIVALLVSIIILLLMNKYFYKENVDTKIFMIGLSSAIIVTGLIMVKAYFHPELLTTNHSLGTFMVNMGYSIGTIFGWYLCKRWINFDTEKCTWVKRTIRIIPGLALLYGLLLMGLPYLTNKSDSIGKGFLYAGFLGMFITSIYPWLFSKIESRIQEKKQDI